MKRWGVVVVSSGLVVAAGAAGVLLKRNSSVTTVQGESLSSGTEIVMVFIASSDCVGINDPRLAPALNAIRAGLQRQANHNGNRLVPVGVSLDLDHREGLRLLERLGPFEEVVLGRGWLNSGAIRYIWEDIRGYPGIPQIVVTTRTVVASRTVQVYNEELFARKVGVAQIVTWSELMLSQ